MFDDLLDANARYRAQFQDPGVAGKAAKRLAVLTCIDSRIDPLALLGLRPGDAKIIRNAGARVTDDALRSLVIAANLLDADRICVVQHTDCAMAGATEPEFRSRLAAARGVDPDSPDLEGWKFLATTDQMAALREDLARIADCPLMPPGVSVGAFVYDVHTGALNPVGDKLAE